MLLTQPLCIDDLSSVYDIVIGVVLVVLLFLFSFRFIFFSLCVCVCVLFYNLLPMLA